MKNMQIRKAPVMLVVTRWLRYTCVIAEDICIVEFKAPFEFLYLISVEGCWLFFWYSSSDSAAHRLSSQVYINALIQMCYHVDLFNMYRKSLRCQCFVLRVPDSR